MKKLLLAFLTIMTAIAVHAEQVSKQKALQKAQQFMPGKSFTVANSRNFARGDRSQTDEEDFYILNAEGGGFVIVSGDDRTREILGYSKEGTFDLEKAPDNLKWWLDEYARQIEAVKSLPKGTTRTVPSSPRTSWPAVKPLISAKWGQDAPYNYMCPDINGKEYDEEGYDSENRCVTGCVATALAQIMYYWKWPENCPALDGYSRGYYINGIEFVETSKVKGLPATTFKWGKMKDEYAKDEIGEAADAVAELMRYCGQALKMDYGTDGSGSNLGVINFSLFGYSKNPAHIYRNDYTAIQWESLIYDELVAGRPVFYGGDSKYIGHAFVVDGYDGNGLFHINYGWEGNANDYYALTIYEDDQLDESPYLTKGEHIGFRFFQNAVIGLKPSETDKRVLPQIYSCVGNFLTKEYTRSNGTVDFTNVTLPFDIEARYSTPPGSEFKIEVGWGLYKDDQLIKCVGSKKDVIIMDPRTAPAGVKLWISEDLIADFGANLESGQYQLYQIYKLQENEDWSRCLGLQNSLIADITSTTMKLRNAFLGGKYFTVNSITCSDASVNNPITVTANITNNGDWNLIMLNLWIQKQGSNSWINVAQGGASVFRDDSGNVVMTLTLQEPGTYNLKVTSSSSEEALKTAQMTVEECIELVVDHVKYRCSPAYGTAIVVKNEDNYGNANISSITILPTITANGVECKVTAIDDNALEWLPNVSELTIPEGVESIGYCAFIRWRNLERLTIPSTVKEIGQYAFESNNLKTVVSYMTEPVDIYPDVFMTYEWDPVTHSAGDSAFPSATLYVPAGCAKKYREASVWKEFKNIEEMESEIPGDADGDGDVDADDIAAIRDYILTGKTDGFYKKNADINNDGNVNAVDIVLLVNSIKSTQ